MNTNMVEMDFKYLSVRVLQMKTASAEVISCTNAEATFAKYKEQASKPVMLVFIG